MFENEKLRSPISDHATRHEHTIQRTLIKFGNTKEIGMISFIIISNLKCNLEMNLRHVKLLFLYKFLGLFVIHVTKRKIFDFFFKLEKEQVVS